MSKDFNTKDFVIGAIVGGVVGGLTALMFAPKSGKELRDDLSNQSQVVKRKGGDLAVIAKEKSSHLAKVVTEQSSNVVNKVKDIPETIRLKTKSSESEKPAQTIELNPNAAEDEGDKA